MPRSQTTVAVLNGTTVTGLARQVADKIAQAGFGDGLVTNAPDRTRTATLVSYSEGHKAEAQDVARTIKVSPDAVQPMDQNTSVVAGDNADVVVTVGQDRAGGL